LLASGIGALIFTGLDSLTGYGTFSLAIPNLPAAGTPTVAEFGWAVAIGLVAGPLSVGIRWMASSVRDRTRQHVVAATAVLGAVIAGLAIGYEYATDHEASDVLFSGQSALPGLVTHASAYSVGALGLLVVCKALAYVAALSAFRGGPIFPAMFIGAAGGVALSHCPGLELGAAVAMGLGAMTAGMLRLPMTAVLLTTLFLGSDGFPVMPLTIVAVVVSYFVTNRLTSSPGIKQSRGT
jgi:H+/Cl- antiporter ClcA